MNVMDFFRGMGHFLSRTLTIVRKIVPEDLLLKAIALAQEAATKYTTNVARREYVLGQLMKIPGMSESLARLVVELAVQHLKADVIDKAAGKAVVEVKGVTP